ncbi:hypothetical protein L873DRAFT_324216 [Choiromyces venosus 120613-1]|uniref:Uncharacterized protein n=1 Tax=Choiromyces venosus 120613-1 TaxID=1336337 RepID=A0A3N4JX05_9PEZI|nr:hypothetical protein L873DRAFT_324216 [Choiromyces venosus 120613-1]
MGNHSSIHPSIHPSMPPQPQAGPFLITELKGYPRSGRTDRQKTNVPHSTVQHRIIHNPYHHPRTTHRQQKPQIR